MIKKSDIQITGIFNDKYRLTKVYRGGYVIFDGDSGKEDTVSSCFGGGYWSNSLPWINTDAWKDN